jgi:hypothetical protein
MGWVDTRATLLLPLLSVLGHTMTFYPQSNFLFFSKRRPKVFIVNNACTVKWTIVIAGLNTECFAGKGQDGLIRRI